MTSCGIVNIKIGEKKIWPKSWQYPFKCKCGQNDTGCIMIYAQQQSYGYIHVNISTCSRTCKNLTLYLHFNDHTIVCIKQQTNFCILFSSSDLLQAGDPQPDELLRKDIKSIYIPHMFCL